MDKDLEKMIEEYQELLPKIDLTMAARAKDALEGSIIAKATSLGYSVSFNNFKVTLTK